MKRVMLTTRAGAAAVHEADDTLSQMLLFSLGGERFAVALEACEEVFRTYGLPLVMRSDNGVPFSSTGLLGLSKLSVYWMRLGLVCERIRPAHPEENGRHERMHRTLKLETARPPRGFGWSSSPRPAGC